MQSSNGQAANRQPGQECFRDYLRRSRLPDGRLARFYELRTNRPLYMTRKYELTYDGSDVPTHYSFVVRSQLDSIATHYAAAKRQVEAGTVNARAMDRRAGFPNEPATPAEVRAVIAALDSRGAWVETGTIRVRGKERATEQVIESRTFMRNLLTLANHVAAGNWKWAGTGRTRAARNAAGARIPAPLRRCRSAGNRQFSPVVRRCV